LVVGKSGKVVTGPSRIQDHEGSSEEDGYLDVVLTLDLRSIWDAAVLAEWDRFSVYFSSLFAPNAAGGQSAVLSPNLPSALCGENRDNEAEAIPAFSNRLTWKLTASCAKGVCCSV